MSCPARLLEFDSTVPPPSARGPTPGVNGELLERLLRHRHYLLMAENGVVRDAVEPLREAVDEIEDTLIRLADRESLSDFSEFRGARRRELRDRLQTIIATAEPATREAIDEGLRRLAETEAKTQARILRETLPSGIELNLTGPDTERLAAIIAQPLGGKRYADRMRANFGQLTESMQRSLATSVALGEGIGPAQRRLRSKVSRLGINRATLIARTEIQRVANQTAQDVYRRNSDVLRGMQWIATLDARTCLRCAPLDGREFRLSESFTRPPLHPACRCFLTPVTKSFEELGLDAEEFQPCTRASMNGQVPATTTYPDWFARQPESFQRDVLGPGRFERFKSGDLELEKMATTQRVLPLDQLPERSAGL